MSNIAKTHRRILQDGADAFAAKWNTHNPDDKVELRIVPAIVTEDKGPGMLVKLNLEIKREGSWSVLQRSSVAGLAKDEELLTAGVYASMFVNLIETALLISVADTDRRQHETATGSVNKVTG